MNDVHEQPASGIAPEPVPAAAEPPAAEAPQPAQPPAAATSPRRPGIVRRVLEWFWRGGALKAAADSGVFVPPRARELHRRARLSAELARRALEPSGPLTHGTGDAVACELYREAVFWSLAALAVTRGEAAVAREGDLRALLASADRVLLLQAAPDPDALAELEGTLTGSAFADFAELRPEEQRDLGWRLRRFVEALLNALDATQVSLDRLRFQRLLRVGIVLAFLLVALPVTLLVLDWSEQRRDLGSGKQWKASSQNTLICSSPAQKCPGTQGYFFHTNEEEAPWLMIDLGSKKQFSEVRVFNRTDCCPERAVPLVVEVSNDKKEWKEVASRKDVFDTWKATFPDAKARYVRVRATRRTFLHLSGLRVLR